MNAKKKYIFSAAIAGALVIGLILGRLLAPSSETAAEPHDHSTAAVGATAEEPTTWTCSMHPQIQQSEPGDCPICGMDLIPLQAEDDAEQGPRTLAMSEGAQALAEIRTTEVSRAHPEALIRLVGKLDYDETRERTLSARFPARIDELYVNYDGIKVEPGEHLAKVYSPDLLTAQRELLTAYRSNPDSSITSAAREKLRLWDLLPDQIEDILERGEARDHFELRAPIGGVVVQKNVKEGDYITTGQPLFKIVDLSALWLNLQAYESDLGWLRYGQTVEFTVEAYPGETFTGTIAFIGPELDRQSRTIPVRVNVLNENRRLKPGMFARGTVKARLSDDGGVYAPELAGKWISPMHPEIVKDHPGNCDICGMKLVPAEQMGFATEEEAVNAPVVVPASAVLRTGKRAVVYVRVPNAARPTYEGREIVLGPRAGDSFVVEAGLDAGEEVVTNGAFKIDSALQIQAKPSMMNPEGGGSAHGHDHETADTSSDRAPAEGEGPLQIEPQVAQQMLPAYLELQSALASDDLAGAKAALNQMMDATGHSGPLPDLIHRMLAAESIDALRLPHFETLSNALIASIESHPDAIDQALFVMHCPMASPDGADWLQTREPLQNPYYGASMLTCGTVEKEL